MIIINNEEALRIKCEEVMPDEVGALIITLEAELEYANKLGKGGIGLAAPQIGIGKHIAIVRLNGFKLNLVNCKMVQGYDPAIFKEEGCLSFPGRVEDTMRFQEIVLTNNLVEPYNFIITGMGAVVCQHELDHLNSTLFMDRKVINNSVVTHKVKIGPNDPCYCGKTDPITHKHLKFKKCCGKNK